MQSKSKSSTYKCHKFDNMLVNETWKIINSKRLCQNCLTGLESCKINIHCKNYSNKYHTLLHVYSMRSANSNTEQANLSVLKSVQVSSFKSSQNVSLVTALLELNQIREKLFNVELFWAMGLKIL